MVPLLEKLASLSPWRKVRRFSTIDFDSRQVRIVHAEQVAGEARILNLATADVPEGIDVADAAAFGAFLGRTLGQMGLGNAWILMSVPRSQAILKPLTLPPVATTGELAGMVQYQAEKELTFGPEETVVDFTLETHRGAALSPEEGAQGDHVLVAAVQRPVVEHFRQIAAAAGVRLLRLGLRPYANMRCVEAYRAFEPGRRLALVHITSDEAEINVIEDNALMFSRAAVVKVPAAAEGNEVAVNEAIQTVVTEVARSLHSYLSVESGERVREILVAGGTGIEPRVAEELARRQSVRCEMFDPSRAVGIVDAGADASAFISALGLAVGQAGSADPPFDFLNPKRAPVRRDMTRVVALGAVAAVVVALVGVFASAGTYYWTKDARVARLREECTKLTEENRRVGALAKRVETVEAWVRGGRNWLDHWAYLSGVFPSCTDTYITGLKTNPDGSITFTVKARSSDAINELGKRLSAAGYDFRPGQITTGTDPYGYTYSTSLKVVVKPNMKVDLAAVTPEPRPEDDVSAEQFGKPRPTAVAASSTPGEAARPPEPGAESPYKTWLARMQTLYREKPPSSQEQARREWNLKVEALMKERPPPDPPKPYVRPSGGSEGESSRGKQHRHE